jgi:hypothetical protein
MSERQMLLTSVGRPTPIRDPMATLEQARERFLEDMRRKTDKREAKKFEAIWRVPDGDTSQCESAGSDSIVSVSLSREWSKAVAAPAAEATLAASPEAANSAGVW